MLHVTSYLVASFPGEELKLPGTCDLLCLLVKAGRHASQFQADTGAVVCQRLKGRNPQWHLQITYLSYFHVLPNHFRETANFNFASVKIMQPFLVGGLHRGFINPMLIKTPPPAALQLFVLIK